MQNKAQNSLPPLKIFIQMPNENSMSEVESNALFSLIFHTFRQNGELRSAYQRLIEQTTNALLKCLEERDAYSYGHSMRVMRYAQLLGKSAQLKESELRILGLSAAFHDLGKIGVRDCVLHKESRLDREELRLMNAHAEKSAGILELIDVFQNLVPIVLHHHERCDGKGYPHQLAHSQIPLLSRMILVVDAFDAMTSTRPYRKALSFEHAYGELEKHSGSQFDPDLAKLFIQAHTQFYKGVYKEKQAA